MLVLGGHIRHIRTFLEKEVSSRDNASVSLFVCLSYLYVCSIYLSIYLGGWGGSGCASSWPAPAISWAYITIWSLSAGSGGFNLSLSWQNYSNFLLGKGKLRWAWSLIWCSLHGRELYPTFRRFFWFFLKNITFLISFSFYFNKHSNWSF